MFISGVLIHLHSDELELRRTSRRGLIAQDYPQEKRFRDCPGV